MSEHAAAQMRSVAIACLVALMFVVIADLAPASGSAKGATEPVCDPFAPEVPGDVCAERMEEGLGPIADLAVTDSGDLYVLGGSGTVVALGLGAAPEVARFRLEGVVSIEAGHRSLLVATGSEVRRHRVSRGQLIPEQIGYTVAPVSAIALELGRLGRLFVTTGTEGCLESCGQISVHDALEGSVSTGRSLSQAAGVEALAAMPGGDLVYAVTEGAGLTRVALLGDHHGFCDPASCTGLVLPLAAGDIALEFAAGDVLPERYREGSFVTGGHQVWFVSFVDGEPVAVHRFATAESGSLMVGVGVGGETYLADRTSGVLWRLTARR